MRIVAAAFVVIALLAAGCNEPTGTVPPTTNPALRAAACVPPPI